MFRYNKNGQSKEIEKKSKRNRKRILDGGIDIDVVIKDFLLGGRYVIKIDNENTIKELIEKCKEKSPIDETKFKYVLKKTHDGEILSDWSKTISDCGIEMESTLELTTKNIAFCGLYVFTDYGHRDMTSILILNDDNTGHHIASQSQNSSRNTYTNDVVWIHSNNILKILIMTKPQMDNRAIVRRGSRQIFLINTTNYFGYYNCIRYNSPPFNTDIYNEYKRKDFVFEELSTKESRIEFLDNFNPLIHSLAHHSVFGSVEKLLRVSFDDGIQFVGVLEDMIHNVNMFFLEHIIKVFRYMDKGVFAEVFKFDNPENMKKSIEMMIPSLFSRTPDDTCRKQLMAVIELIPRMDIFDK